MAVRNFVLKLVQKGSGKRTHVTIEQEAGSGVEPQVPKVEYTFKKSRRVTDANSIDIYSFKRVDGGDKQAVDWGIGAVSGDGANLVSIRKRDGGVDIFTGHNTSEKAKNWSVILTQEESGKTIELGDVIDVVPKEKRYEFSATESVGSLKGYSYLYTVISLLNNNYVPFNVSVYGDGSDLVKTEIFNELNAYYLGIGISKNMDPVQKSVKITLTQEGSGKKVEINKIIKPYVKPIYTFDVEKTGENRYVVTSLANQKDFVDFNVDVSGEGKRLVSVDRNERRKELLRVSLGVNNGDTDLPYVITLTQNESGNKRKINGVVKKAGVTPGDDDLRRKLLITKKMQEYTSSDGSCVFGVDPKTNQKYALCTYFSIHGFKVGDTVEAMVRYQLIKDIDATGNASCGLINGPHQEGNWYEAVAKAENVSFKAVDFGEDIATPFTRLEVSDYPNADRVNIIKVWDIKVKNKDGLECSVDVEMMGNGKAIDPVW